VTFADSEKGIDVTLDGVNEGIFSTSGPLLVFGRGGKDTVKEGAGLKNRVHRLQSTMADNVQTDLDSHAIQWAGLSAAVESLNA
jgi:hypothetical protein